MESHRKSVVIFAFLANVAIALAKLGVYFITRSSSMLSESVHSFADTGNQILLLVGIKRSQKAEDRIHPFGYSREKFFWAFLVAIQLFGLGGLYSIYEGTEKIIRRHPLSNYPVAIFILLFSMVAEGFSFHKAKRAVDSKRGDLNLLEFLKKSPEPEIIVVFLEDLAAILGLSFAVLFISFSWALKNPLFDGIGSLFIGAILIVVAAFLGSKMKSLIIGEAAPPEVSEYAVKILSSKEGVERVIYLKTMLLGSDSILIAGKVAFRKLLSAEDISRIIDSAEEKIRNRFSEVKRIYIETDIYKPEKQNNSE